MDKLFFRMHSSSFADFYHFYNINSVKEFSYFCKAISWICVWTVVWCLKLFDDISSDNILRMISPLLWCKIQSWLTHISGHFHRILFFMQPYSIMIGLLHSYSDHQCPSRGLVQVKDNCNRHWKCDISRPFTQHRRLANNLDMHPLPL